MKIIYKLITIVALSLYVSISHAWVTGGGVKVNREISWQDDNPVVIEFSNGLMCYIPANEKNLYSLMLSVYASGKTADIHCRDEVTSIAGFDAHRLHRVVANK